MQHSQKLLLNPVHTSWALALPGGFISTSGHGQRRQVHISGQSAVTQDMRGQSLDCSIRQADPLCYSRIDSPDVLLESLTDHASLKVLAIDLCSEVAE